MKTPFIKKFKKVQSIIIISHFIASNFLYAEDIKYKIVSGDNLSTLMKKNYPGRTIYGPKGTLKVIIIHNNLKHDGNLIYQNQIILLLPPEEMDQTISNLKTEIANNITNKKIDDVFPDDAQAFVKTETLIPIKNNELVIRKIASKDDIQIKDDIQSKDVPENLSNEQKESEHKNIKEQKKENDVIDEKSELNLGLSLGFGSYTISQEETLGSIAGNTISIGTVKFDFSSFQNEIYIDGNYSTYPISFATPAGNKIGAVKKLSLGGPFEKFYTGIEVTQSPLINKLGSTVESTDLSMIWAELGLRVKKEGLSKKGMSLKTIYKFIAGIPISGNASNSVVEIDGISGYKISGAIKNSREIKRFSNSALFIVLGSKIELDNSQFDVTWNTTSGKVAKKDIVIDLSCGAELSF